MAAPAQALPFHGPTPAATPAEPGSSPRARKCLPMARAPPCWGPGRRVGLAGRWPTPAGSEPRVRAVELATAATAAVTAAAAAASWGAGASPRPAGSLLPAGVRARGAEPSATWLVVPLLPFGPLPPGLPLPLSFGTARAAVGVGLAGRPPATPVAPRFFLLRALLPRPFLTALPAGRPSWPAAGSAGAESDPLR